MKRQFFICTLATVALLAVMEGFAAGNSSVPPLGVGGGLQEAVAVKAAGGSFVAASVAGWLRPDEPETKFLKSLEQVRQSPLPVWSCNSFIRRKDLKCVGPEANHDAVMAYAEIAFERAGKAGVKGITFGSSGSRRVPEGFPVEEAKRQFVALLQRMGPVAEKHGVTVMVEQLRQKECNFVNTISEVAEIVRAADHPAIRANADLFHMVIEGDTPDDLKEAADLIAIVEIAEAEGRRVPGTGGQDFRPYFKVLKEAGFTGPINIEGRWEVAELEKAFAEISRQWVEAGD
ncbi:MAG: sugar phosphate isomerase/epimerase family protein [Puniceicoccaceae bacterium]